MMEEEYKPYIIFLPSAHEDQIALLTSVFGSEVKLEILGEFRADKEIYQKNLIAKLPYSNKTVITHLKELVSLRILKEDMVKKESTWVKKFTVNESMKWLVSLLRDPDTLPEDEMKEMITEFLHKYIESIFRISEHYGIDKKEIRDALSDIYEKSA